MGDTSFVTSSPPPEVYKLPDPTIEQVDNHPDRDFIWSVIMATRYAAVREGISLLDREAAWR